MNNSITKITQFDPHNCRRLIDALDNAVAPVADAFGVHITHGGGSYLATNFRITLQAATKGENGEIISREVIDFKELCGLYGLKPEDLGKTFSSYTGEVYKIIGLKSNSRKFPILVEKISNGKKYKLPETLVVRGLREKGTK